MTPKSSRLLHRQTQIPVQRQGHTGRPSMPAEMSRNAKILATLGIALAMFLAALDQTIVGTALPRIVAELQGLDYYAWVATSYMVASTTMTPISGKLGDLFGRRSALLVGIVGFVLASALCGQAQDMTQLIAFRGVQGLFVGLLAFAAIMGVIFFLIERREKNAIVPFGLWKNRTFAVSMTTSFLVAFGMFGAILYVPLIYQGILGIAATNSGLLVTPMMVGLISGSVLTGQIITRIDRYRLVGTVATLVMVSGLWLLGQVSVDTKEIEVVRDLVLVGLGLGATFPLYINASQAAVPRQYLGVVSSQIQFWRNIGGTIGVAIFGAILSHDLPKKIQENIAALNLPPAIVSNLSASTSPPALFDPASIPALRAAVPPALEPVIDQILIAVRAALASTIYEGFFYATLIVGIAAVVSVFLKDVPIRAHTPAERRQVADAEQREEVPSFSA